MSTLDYLFLPEKCLHQWESKISHPESGFPLILLRCSAPPAIRPLPVALHGISLLVLCRDLRLASEIQ